MTWPVIDLARICLSTPGDEHDPWLTADGKTLYFTSDRDGALNI